MRQWTDPLATQAYSPHAEPPSALAVAPWGFTGEWHDPTGLVYLRARWYNHALGRFTQADPFPGLLPEPGTGHPYAYALNSPALRADPSGQIIEAILGGFVGGAVIAYGAQVAGNIYRQGLSRDAFTDVDWGGVFAGGVAGAVGAATFGASGGLRLGTGWRATLGTGAVSGVLSGQAARAGYNWWTGQPLGRGLGQPTDLITDAVAGAAGAAVGKAWDAWKLRRQAPGCGWKNGWRTTDGKYASPLGPGRSGEAAEIGVWDAIERTKVPKGWELRRGYVSARDASGTLRVYDGAVRPPGSRKWIGLEVKSGTGRLEPRQRAFDTWLNSAAANIVRGVGKSRGMKIVRALLIER